MKNNNTKPTIFHLRDLIKNNLALWFASWLLGLITAVSVVGLLMVSGWFLTVTAVVGLVSLQGINYHLAPLLIRIFALTRTLGRYAELVVAHNAIFSLLRDLRVQFFQILAKQPLTSYHDSLKSSQKMHRLVSDINALNEFNLRIILPWLTAIVIVCSIVTLLFLSKVLLTFISPEMIRADYYYHSMYIMVVVLALCIVIPTIMAYKGVSYNRSIASLAERRRSDLLAPLSIIPQLLMWQQWQPQTKNFIMQDTRLQTLQWQAEKHKSTTMLIVQWLIYTLVLLVLYVTATTALSPLLLALLLAIIFGIFGLQEVLLPLAQHYLSYGKAKVAKERLNAMVLVHTDVGNTNNIAHKPLLPLPTSESLIMELQDISAKIPNAIIGAENVNCKVQAGVPMIISGASGCGKSTLLQTLANELIPQSGQILLNGQKWQDFDWADELGYLGQQLDIFDQTLADNLRLGKTDTSDEELLTVLDKVALTDWVQAQPQGLQTQLGEYGTAVSGGQARRIALARLLLKPRAVLLLDEPFAGLDKTSQAKLWQTVREHQQSALLIVVSHHQSWQNIGVVDRLELKL